jgi:hypothetical protein
MNHVKKFEPSEFINVRVKSRLAKCFNRHEVKVKVKQAVEDILAEELAKETIVKEEWKK